MTSPAAKRKARRARQEQKRQREAKVFNKKCQWDVSIVSPSTRLPEFKTVGSNLKQLL